MRDLAPDSRAIKAAENAAAAAGGRNWLLGRPLTSAEATLAAKLRPELAMFMLQHDSAPADAMYIRAGALGLHDGLTPFAALPGPARMAYGVFASTLREVQRALDRQAQQEAQALAEEKARALAAEQAARGRAEAELEGTMMEKLGGLSELRPSGDFGTPSPGGMDAQAGEAGDLRDLEAMGQDAGGGNGADGQPPGQAPAGPAPAADGADAAPMGAAGDADQSGVAAQGVPASAAAPADVTGDGLPVP